MLVCWVVLSNYTTTHLRHFDQSAVNMTASRVLNFKNKLLRLPMNTIVYFLVACVIFSSWRSSYQFHSNTNFWHLHGSRNRNVFAMSETHLERYEYSESTWNSLKHNNPLDSKASDHDIINTLYISDKIYWSEYAEQSVAPGQSQLFLLCRILTSIQF